MLHDFLDTHRAELIERCRANVARRGSPRATRSEIEHGIPLFLAQLTGMLRHDQDAAPGATAGQLSGFAGPVRDRRSEIATSAGLHGKDLLHKGFTVTQVVYDYGDLCQAITELAGEKEVEIPTEEFRTLNRALDNAIANAVTAFSRERDALNAQTDHRAMSERLGFLAHELRNFLNTAMLSFAAIKTGKVAVNGATAAVLDRSLGGLRDLIDRALADVRLAAGVPSQLLENIEVDHFLAEVQVATSLEAKDRGCEFTVFPVPAGLVVHGDRQMLHSAVSNLLQNAVKFTRDHSHVSLKAFGTGERVIIEVEDQCGGLPAGKVEALFHSFEQHHENRTGLGLGLSIAKRGVEINGGTLTVRDMPGLGCVFTIDLPAVAAASDTAREPRPLLSSVS
ncbi:hypothetical protein BWI17_11745 [Betaproteobacteria bacterium GR16-43]|nr:hypothetical protein BWI17_11745 [Betaproteobacteria bacterium GR16-43]